MADDLLSPPPAKISRKEEPALSRVQGSYKPTYQRFVVSGPDASNSQERQYSHIFRRRLQGLAGPVKKAAMQKWQGSGYRFADQAVQISIGEKIAIVGIVTKKMSKMPDVLQELSQAEKGVGLDNEDDEAADSKAILNFVSDDDKVILEDRSGRIALGGDIDASMIVPGVVMGFRGVVAKGPVLLVEDSCFPGFAPQPALPAIDLGGPTEEFVLFVSGVGFGSSKFDSLRTKLLLDFVSGSLGGKGDAQRSANISRVVLAGKSLVTDSVNPYLKGANARNVAAKAKLVEPLSELDFFVSHLAASVAVDLLPGDGEPTNALLPQQALHRCLLPNAARFSSYRSVTNPHTFVQSGAHVAVTAGQPINNLRQYINPEVSVCDVMESTLKLRHIAPTAPDTLSAFPLFDKDPFVLEKSPHIYVSGDSPEYASKLVTDKEAGLRTLLVALPSFADSGIAVLVNVRTLAASPVNFGFD